VPEIELAELIDHVADQLVKAELLATKRTEHPMQFETCEIEMAVRFEKSGKGGVKVWVLELGGGATSESSNRITATFKRHGPGGVFLTDEDRGESSVEYQK
jgi:hypothetical protein